MRGLPPGTILQLMYLDERVRDLPSGRFIEVGPGQGEITNLLLKHGWTGLLYELDEVTVDGLRARFAAEIEGGRLEVRRADYVEADATEVDLVISCMVMEHLSDDNEIRYLRKSAENLLERNGLMIGIVPAGTRYWGIEDDIAGHFRRYTDERLQALCEANGWRLQHIRGLTFPVSNILLPISNWLVNRHEAAKLQLSKLDQTKQSGRRNVAFKTKFPSLFSVILNRYVLYPLHLLQKMPGTINRSLVLYFEARPHAR